MSLEALLVVGFLFGIGLGYFAQRAGLCFAQGLGEIFRGKGRRICRLFSVIFIVSALGFLLSGYLSSSLGLKPVGELRGYGFYNLLAGILFGAGILLTGGCMLGTLRRLGEGNLTFLVVLLSLIPGMALVVHVINPLLRGGYQTQRIVLPELLGVAAPFVTVTLTIAVAIWLVTLSRKKGLESVLRSQPDSEESRVHTLDRAPEPQEKETVAGAA